MRQRAVLDYNKLAIMVLIGAIAYNEFFSYYSYYLRWPSLPPDPGAGDGCDDHVVKILLVADPQIQGYMNEGKWGVVRRWDIDRYLDKTFAWAMSGYSPDVVVFLGDLLDEGSEADDEDYVRYVNRFKSIYGIVENNGVSKAYGAGGPEVVFTAGDNDVGGEGGDKVTEEKVSRFEKHFKSLPKCVVKRCKDSKKMEIIPVNMLVDQIRTEKESFLYDNIADPSEDVIKVVVSHMPILPLLGETSFVSQVLKLINPSVIFSAHDHHGMDYGVFGAGSEKPYSNYTRFSLRKYQADRENLKKQKEFMPVDLKGHQKDAIHDIIVPTCSYRMGEKEMAFGLAIFDVNSDQFHYANLWLPSRFALLYVYLAAVICSIMIFLIGKVQSLRRGSPKYPGTWKRRRSSGSPSPKIGRRSRSREYSKLV